MADDVYDGPGTYDEAAPYEDPFMATVHILGHATLVPKDHGIHDGRVII